MEVEVNLITFVFIGFQRREIFGLTFITAGGIGSAGNRAGDTDTDFFTLHFPYRHHVDAGQKVG
ncbi:hypothetical protein D3C75_687420 [compost metagenome]